jgi:8-oxo-dGTP diphosphatase
MDHNAYSYEYPRPALTADIVCVNRGRILLVRRGQQPFKGFWAFAGGFVEEGESAVQGAARELGEETTTSIDVERFVELGVFSTPGRDPRGWVVSVAFMVELTDDEASSVAAADDAADVGFFDPLTPPLLAFDHDEILRVALPRMRKLQIA